LRSLSSKKYVSRLNFLFLAKYQDVLKSAKYDILMKKKMFDYLHKNILDTVKINGVYWRYYYYITITYICFKKCNIDNIDHPQGKNIYFIYPKSMGIESESWHIFVRRWHCQGFFELVHLLSKNNIFFNNRDIEMIFFSVLHKETWKSLWVSKVCTF